MNLELMEAIDQYIKEQHYRLINSVLVYHQGKIVAENYYHSYSKESRHRIQSIWKSILSLCIGICVDKGYLNLNDPISKYLEAFDQMNYPYHRILKIRDLLTMTSGIYWNGGVHYHCPMLEQLWQSDDWIKHIADIAMVNIPGREFAYKEWDVILLSAIISKVTNNSTFDFCNSYIYQPLGIHSAPWGMSECGVNYNWIPNKEDQANLTATDLLKIGELLLNGGVCQQQQIVSNTYIKEMVFPSQKNQRYGYLIWLFDDYYACRGFGGQEIIVSPKQQLITVIQATMSSRGKSYEDLFEDLIGGWLGM